MDWQKIRELFIRFLLDTLKEIETEGEDFLQDFLKELAKEGYVLTPELEQKLREFLHEIQKELYGHIHTVLEVAYYKAKPALPKDEFISSLASTVIDQIYPDGLSLSQRLYRWEAETLRGIKEVIRRGALQGISAQRLRYEIQYFLEHTTSEEFKTVLADDIPQYLKNVIQQAKALGPEHRAFFEKELSRALKKIEKLKRTESIANAKQLLKELDKAVEKQSQELIERAVRWWIYNRQLTRFKTIAQTELANAFHLAQIRATEEDADVVGYQWRLSASHPRRDICNVYATIDYGLGKGVWPKDKVPRRKPHPHCLCYLLPVIKRKSHKEKEPEIDRQVLLSFAPKWIKRLVGSEGRDILDFWNMEEGRFITREEFGF